MAIHVKYNIPGRDLLPRETFERRILFAKFICNELDIKIQKSELWKNEFIQSLDGQLLSDNEEKMNEEIEKISYHSLPLMIHKIEGELNINNIRLVVSLITHNRRNSKIYGDLEIRIYNHDIEDLIPIEDFQNKIRQMVDYEKNRKMGIKVNLIAIGDDPDSLIDIRKRYLCYHYFKRDLIEDLLKTMRIESEEMHKPLFDSYFKPYHLSFISSSIEQAPQFPSFLDEMQSEANLEISEIGSIICVAKEKESFEKIYTLFRDDFIKTVKKDWPNKEKIEGIIKNWIGRHKSFDNFPSD